MCMCTSQNKNQPPHTPANRTNPMEMDLFFAILSLPLSRSLSLSLFVGVLYRSRQHFIYRWLRWKIRAREYEHRFLTSAIRGNVGNAMDGHKRMAVCVLLFRTLQTVNIDLYSYRNRKCGCSYTMSGSIGNDK